MDIWRQLDTNCFESGRNWLVRLAIRILSVIANSAGCERLFSAMGLLHTKTRNRLNLDRVQKSVYLKSVLQREQQLLGWVRPRLKRRIDVSMPVGDSHQQGLGDTDVTADTFVSEEDITFEAGAQLLMDEAMADVEDETQRCAYM